MLSNFFNFLLVSYPLTPKIGIFGIYIYLQEIFIILYITISVLASKVESRHISIVSLAWALQLYILANYFLTGDPVHLAYFKQLMIFNILLIPSSRLVNIVSTQKLFNLWLIVACANLAYIVLIKITENPGALTYLFEYSPKYRIIGLTGAGFDLLSGQLKSSFSGDPIGTTTISLSILLALGTIHSACYQKMNKLRVFLFFVVTLLTMSRSGPLVLIIAIAVAYLLKTNSRRFIARNFRVITILAVIIVTATVSGSLAINKFDFTNIDTFITVLVRFEMWKNIFTYVGANPMTLLFGVGIYADSVANIVGIDYAESLFFDALLRYGLLGAGAFVMIFIMMFSMILNSKNNSPERFALLLFLPGFFVVNWMAGSSLLTDFLLPLILVMLAKGTSPYVR